ncbi:hypothetical protein RI844_04415 [Thalassotalea fonticola]|uniref:Uncharacterized protein n=1 Tax=Thalassotalea fonticola TaxID=3065649 RepID=A0ABZ0GT03_9GAMM|nr:hypothetical protein RI844_04415 [Colwelliaceae bacterium S1-1]
MSNFYTAIILILLIILGFLGYQFIETDKPQIHDQNYCDFSAGSCLRTYAFGRFELNASPNVIMSENEIYFSLTSKSNPSMQIKSAWLEGKDMFMGKIPLFFEQSNGIYSANTLIGACTEDQMIWTMWVELIINDKIEILMFDFTSYQ